MQQANFKQLEKLQERFDSETSQGLSAIKIGDFLAKELPRRELLLAPVLPRQGLVLIHGPRGIAKTFVALNIAYAIVSGGSYLKWKAPEPRGVLYLDGEMPAPVLQERCASIVQASAKTPEADLLIVTPDLNRGYGMPDLSTEDGQTAIDALVTDGIELIIVDNLSCLCRTGKENEAESWLAVQTWALRHRAAGRSVLFVHHTGKNGLQRGTSRREDVLDTVLGLRWPHDYDATEGARFECHIEKGRGIFGDDAEPFEARLELDEKGQQVWSTKYLTASRREKIKEMANEGLKDREIAEILGIDRSTVYRNRKAAQQEGG